MAAEEITIPVQQEEDFQITDEKRANWLLRKLANIEAEKARIRVQAAEIVKSLDSDAARLQHLFGSQLESFAREELAKSGGRSKTLRLLQGTLAFRTVPAYLKIEDEAAAMEYIRQEDLPCVDVKVSLDCIAYRRLAEQALEASGELLPGMERIGERESFSLKFARSEEE